MSKPEWFPWVTGICLGMPLVFAERGDQRKEGNSLWHRN